MVELLKKNDLFSEKENTMVLVGKYQHHHEKGYSHFAILSHGSSRNGEKIIEIK